MRPLPRLNEYLDERAETRPRRLAWVIVLVAIVGALTLFVGTFAHAAECVTSYRALPAHHGGWRRFHVVDGRKCWFVDAHRRAHKRSEKRETIPLPRPRPVIAQAEPTPAQRVRQSFDLFLLPTNRAAWHGDRIEVLR